MKQTFLFIWTLQGFIWIFTFISCDYQPAINTKVPLEQTLFDSATVKNLVENDQLNEASGLIVSRQNADFLWSHNDSGDKPRLFVFNTKGQHIAEFIFPTLRARDWEDLAMYFDSTQNKSYILLADIGDNEAVHDTNFIYIFEEPLIPKKPTQKSIIIREVQTLMYIYPDGKRDAETLMIDPKSGDILIVSKREKEVHLYSTPFPKNFSTLITLKKEGILPFQKIVAGDISPDGTEILLKDYDNIYYWKKRKNESIVKLLKSPAKRLPYSREPQGEAIAWDTKGKGFYTLSEERKQIPAKLYFYPRK